MSCRHKGLLADFCFFVFSRAVRVAQRLKFLQHTSLKLVCAVSYNHFHSSRSPSVHLLTHTPEPQH